MKMLLPRLGVIWIVASGSPTVAVPLGTVTLVDGNWATTCQTYQDGTCTLPPNKVLKGDSCSCPKPGGGPNAHYDGIAI